jgi:hypothetical protein
MWKNLKNMVKIDGTIEGQNLAKSYSLLFEHDSDDAEEKDEDEWLKSAFLATAVPAFVPFVSGNDLKINRAEEVAEKFILGNGHWEYSKVSACACDCYFW